MENTALVQSTSLQDKLVDENAFYVKAKAFRVQDAGKYVCITKLRFGQRKPARIYKRENDKILPVVDIYSLVHLCQPQPETSKLSRHSKCKVILHIQTYTKNTKIYKTHGVRLFKDPVSNESTQHFYAIMAYNTALIFEPEPGIELSIYVRRIKPKYVEVMFYDSSDAKHKGYNFSRRYENL